MSKACEKYGSFLVHFSTDYVFDGEKEGMYTESDEPRPLNYHGETKLLGEELVQRNLERFLIFRIGGLYGHGKQNFLYKVEQWTTQKEILRISCDDFLTPTSTRLVVNVTIRALSQNLHGLYHLCNSGYTSRFELVLEYLRLRNIDKFVYPVYRSEFKMVAKRPRFSVLTNEKVVKELGIEIPNWREELENFVRTLQTRKVTLFW